MIIGIIGGGQLGMMMAEQAKLLGHKIISLDPNSECSITRYSDTHIAKDYSDSNALDYMNEICDVITYEFENVNLDVLELYLKKIPQKLKALEISKNRISEKLYAKSLGIRIPKFNSVESKKDIFSPSILKTNTGGYDGKGQFKIQSISDIDHVILKDDKTYICEELIAFDYEISVIATRDVYGTIALYPIPINEHKNGILFTSVVEDKINKFVEKTAYEYSERIINDLDYVGTLAIEFFVKNDQVVFNEFAPRPHNSGHYTMDGCNVSQFKNHILAITGRKVEIPILTNKTIMINVLGQNKTYYLKSKKIKSSIIHDYYKQSEKVDRKIGHINITYQKELNFEDILQKIVKE